MSSLNPDTSNSIKSNVLFEHHLPELYYQQHPRPILIGDGLRNADNIGALIRLADNIGAERALFTGSIDKVNHSKIRRCAASSFSNIDWEFADVQHIDAIVQNGFTLVCVETSRNATNIFDTPLPLKPAFVVGNEVHGISDQLLQRADTHVFIPVPGPTRSLNVSHAMGIAIFEWWRQMHLNFQ